MNIESLEWNCDYGPAKNEDVIRLEAAIGCSLPHPYRAFLLKKNGGTLAANELVVGECVEDIERFFGFRDVRGEHLIDVWKMWQVHFPGSVYLPIGGNGCGDHLLLHTRDGSIAWAYHEQMETEGDVVPVCASLNQLPIRHVRHDAPIWRDALENDDLEQYRLLKASVPGLFEEVAQPGIEGERAMLLMMARLNARHLVRDALARGVDPTGAVVAAIIAAGFRERGNDVSMLVRELLNAGCSPNERLHGNGNTALMIAVKHKNTSVIQVLIDAGADPTAQNNYGQDAFHFGYDPSMIQESTATKKPRRIGWLARMFSHTAKGE